MTKTRPAPAQPDWCRPLRPHRWNRLLSGAASGELADCQLLIEAAYGKDVQFSEGVGLAAFAYLYRRFGPSPIGYDPDKDLAQYVLETPERGVFLSVYPGASSLKVGYLARRHVYAEAFGPDQAWLQKVRHWGATHSAHTNLWEALMDRKFIRAAERALGPRPKNYRLRQRAWKKDASVIGRASRALLATMVELLRPVAVRDEVINILGVAAADSGVSLAPAAPTTGYGVDPPKVTKWPARKSAN